MPKIGMPKETKARFPKSMDLSIWASIHRLKTIEQLSERKIAEHLGISRGAVRRGLNRVPGAQKTVIKHVSKLEQYKALIQEWIVEYPSFQRIHGTTNEKPCDRFEKEKAFLLSLPDHDYDTSIPVSAKVYEED